MPRKSLLVQDYLRTNGVESIGTALKVTAKRHSVYSNLVLFKYDQIESPMDNPIVQQCRGLILDEAKDWAVVARPYDKFFNHGEHLAAKIDWSTAKIYEKLDGSLMTLYWYDNQWHVATSGTPDAMGEAQGDPNKRTFKQLFWDTWNQLGYELPRDKDRNTTFIFELMTPFNKVVVQHATSRLVLHGARYIDGDQEELNPEYCDAYRWQIVDSYRLRSGPDTIQKYADDLGPGTKSEGFVVCDHLFRRVKVKNKDYLRLHRMVDGMSVRKMLEMIRANESDEFLVYFPEWKELYWKIKNDYSYMINQVAFTYETIQHIENQKDFAMAAKDHRCSGALFALRSGKAKSLQEYFANLNIRNLEHILGLKGEADGLSQ